MESLRIIVEEQQAISLVALGLLSLVTAFSFRRFIKPGIPAKVMSQAFWLSQAILASSGVAIIVWPTFGFAAVMAAVFGCIVLVLQLDRRLRRYQSNLA